MTLKEKFKQIDIKLSKNNTTKIVDVEAIQCEKIADDYAIEFAEWYFKKAEKYDSYLKLKKDSKELLEIYKKEKGL
jgi:hypothetical protein